jgi:hypothetical protein
MSQVPPTFTANLILLKISPLFLEIMVLWMVTFYGPKATQVNEEAALESYLDLTLMQHPRDENPASRTMHARLEINPLRACYYRIFPNSHTLVILLQVDPASGDKPKTISEGYYKTKDISIFSWSSVPGVGHYRWLCNLINRLLLNNKADYLIRTIQRILDFLQL